MLFVNENAISYYDFNIVDTSQIAAFDLAQTFSDYKTDTVLNSVLSDYSSKVLYECKLVQSRIYFETTWAINSLDLILGLVGGFTAMIWATLAMAISNYEDFSFT